MDYIPITEEDKIAMLKVIGVTEINDLFPDIPQELMEKVDYKHIPSQGLSEYNLINELEQMSLENKQINNFNSFLGGGIYNHFIPTAVDSIISRPEFFTAYTPYQAEVSQGTLQTIFEFQTFISELTGMEIANASMYDGATAAAESLILSWRVKKRNKVAVSKGLNPDYRKVIGTYLKNTGIEIVELSLDGKTGRTIFDNINWPEFTGGIIASPNYLGIIEDLKGFSETVHSGNALSIVSINPISLGILKTPGELGVDLAIGNGQVFGNKMYLGGPSFGFFTSTKALLRNLPGRLVGKTQDTDGKDGYVLTLQTREQHIRRERATSNICTNQALNALAGTVYLSILGRSGLREVSRFNAIKTHYLIDKLSELEGVEILFDKKYYFNEFTFSTKFDSIELLKRMKQKKIYGGISLSANYPEYPGAILTTVTEVKSKLELDEFVMVLKELLNSK